MKVLLNFNQKLIYGDACDFTLPQYYSKRSLWLCQFLVCIPDDTKEKHNPFKLTKLTYPFEANYVPTVVCSIYHSFVLETVELLCNIDLWLKFSQSII